MNWSKIKTILIVVLLITNIFLGYTFVIEKVRFKTEYQNNMNDVIKLYQTKGITVDLGAFHFPRTIRSVNVSFETYDVSYINLLLGSANEFDGSIYKNSSHSLILKENQIIYGQKEHFSRIQHDNADNLKPFSEIQDQGIRKNFLSSCQTFLKSVSLNIEYNQYDVKTLGDYTVVQLYQFHDEYLMDESKLNIWFYKDQPVGFSRKNIVKFDTIPGTKYDIITVDRVLYELLPELSQGDKIVDLEVVYKLNDESLMVNNLVSGEALPYYQLKLSSGQLFYVKAVNYF